MTKIKSTLDIVMERTKGLSMTPDDREKIRIKELAESARGIMGKYLDEKIPLKDVEDYLSLTGKDRPDILDAMKAEFITRVQLDQDNTRELEALATLWGIDGDKVGKAFMQSRERLHELMAG